MAQGDPFLAAIEALDGVPSADGKPTLEFRFTRFAPSAFWPSQLNAFPVLEYRPDPVQPEGSMDQPITIAVNSLNDIDTQLLAATSYVVSTLRRQAGVGEVRDGTRDLESLVGSAQEIEDYSRAESIALARAMRAGAPGEVRIAVSRWGFGIRTKYIPSWLNRDGFTSRIPFFANCYNSLAFVQEAVDRIVGITVGHGGRISGASEEARNLVEQASQDARMSSFIAHAIRDSIVFGAGAMALDVRFGLINPRVLRPDRIELVADDPTHVIETDDTGRRALIRALVLPGQVQPGSIYPASILEAWAYSLRAILAFRADAEAGEAILPPPGERSEAAQSLAESLQLVRAVADQFEQNVAPFFASIGREFEAVAHPPYFRGHERWP